jgi:nucleoid DNA-binding protein
MKKKEIAERLASKTRTSPGAAADQLDQIVHQIIRSLKQGKPAALPGLGTFTPADGRPGFRFDPLPRKPARSRAKS